MLLAGRTSCPEYHPPTHPGSKTYHHHDPRGIQSLRTANPRTPAEVTVLARARAPWTWTWTIDHTASTLEHRARSAVVAAPRFEGKGRPTVPLAIERATLKVLRRKGRTMATSRVQDTYHNIRERASV
ncbi:hypothetical protein PLICRDRAFT_259686 [Plicaturopsis crispa FD-325 SS-3]|nr:hypothetical protein PLICRDRAFT_259686 [Plicaturopsis crispa FD-325 SS-3]